MSSGRLLAAYRPAPGTPIARRSGGGGRARQGFVLVASLALISLVAAGAALAYHSYRSHERPEDLAAAGSASLPAFRSACPPDQPPPSRTIGVVVRTHPGQALALPVALATLGLACNATAGQVTLQLVLVNTDPGRPAEVDYLHAAIGQARPWLAGCPCATAEVLTFAEPPWAGTYGYDYTQAALEVLLYGCRLDGPAGECLPANASASSLLPANATRARLDYLLFTNGDNLFNTGILAAVAPAMSDGTDIIAFSFVSHHARGRVRNTVINVEFRRKFIDLSAAFYSKQLLLKAGKHVASFLPEGRNTGDMYARDWHFVHGLMGAPNTNTTTTVVPQVLLFHQ